MYSTECSYLVLIVPEVGQEDGGGCMMDRSEAVLWDAAFEAVASRGDGFARQGRE